MVNDPWLLEGCLLYSSNASSSIRVMWSAFSSLVANAIEGSKSFSTFCISDSFS